MKTIEYWEAKRTSALRALRALAPFLPPKFTPSPRKGKGSCGHLRWSRVYFRWKKADQVQVNLRRKSLRLLARLDYIEARIRATTPTFWSKL
jgi:hypothetical protein